MASAVRVAAVAALVAACADEREPTDAAPLVTWVGDIAEVAAARCTSCHGGDAPAAGYDLTSYLGALGAGTDATPNAIAGDAASRILAVLDPADPTHAALADVAPTLRTWVVDARLAYRDSRIHAPGLLNPADPDFHGTELAERQWDFAVCAACHGADFGGGTSGAACTTCHADGPTACDTCHGDVPASGAHVAHVAGAALERPIACGECHRVPTRWDEPGHLFTADGAVDPAPAEVVLGALANRDVVPPRRTEPASYDPAARQCSGVYCHGGIVGDAAATDPAPRWDDGDAGAACGSCHGAPPPSHAQAECSVCHSTAVTAGGGFATAHLDGAIDVGDGSGTCTGCHGAAGDPAPPRGLHGETSPSTLAVGAHRAHLRAPSGLRGPMACTECHLVPATVEAANHVDTALPAEVFPPGAGMVARADAAAPAWDHAIATCAGVYCHGAGERLAQDLSPGVRAPVWAGADQQVYCGSCHGIPPLDMYHSETLELADCTTCHPDVDSFGNIILTGPPDALTSEHIDGDIDLR